MKRPMSYDVFLKFFHESDRISSIPSSNGDQLRACAQIHAKLIEHHALVIQNLIDNAKEADMNEQMGKERRAEIEGSNV